MPLLPFPPTRKDQPLANCLDPAPRRVLPHLLLRRPRIRFLRGGTPGKSPDGRPVLLVPRRSVPPRPQPRRVRETPRVNPSSNAWTSHRIHLITHGLAAVQFAFG